MRPYKQFVKAGEEQDIFSGEGGRVIALDADATVNVTVRDPDRNQEFRLKPGAVVRFERFDSLRVSHDGADDTLITLYIGGAEANAESAQVSGSVEITGGVVALSGGVVDGVTDVKNRASSNQNHFITSRVMPSTNYPHVQLYNPVGSGITAYLYSIRARSNEVSPVTYRLSYQNAAIATGSQTAANKYVGGAVSLCTVLTLDSTSNAVGEGLSQPYYFNQYEEVEFIKDVPLVIPAGYGVIVGSMRAGSDLNVVFDFEEV